MSEIEKTVKEFLAPIIRESVFEAILEAKGNGQEKTTSPKVGGVKFAMKITGYSSSTIYKLVSDRSIPFSKPRGKLHFKEDELLEWMQKGKSKTKSNLISEINSYNAKRRRH